MTSGMEPKRWQSTDWLLGISLVAFYLLILISIFEDDILGSDIEVSYWDWVGVLIIPVSLIAGGMWIKNTQIQREAATASLYGQDEALQKYLDQLGNLLIQHKLRDTHPNSDVRKLAQGHTLTLLLKLDRDRKRHPLKLIAQLDLINKDEPLLDLKNAGLENADLHEVALRSVSLREADLRLADLTGAQLSGSDLTLADLRGADLRRAVLIDTSLSQANLLPYDHLDPAQLNTLHLSNGARPSDLDTDRVRRRLLTQTRYNSSTLTLTRLEGANLQGANLSSAFLYRADLTKTTLCHANLRGANLRNSVLADADLTGADLTGADLTDADMRRVDFTGAVVAEEQLHTCKSLDGAKLPDELT